MDNFKEKYINLFCLNEELGRIIESALNKFIEPNPNEQHFNKRCFLFYALTKSYETQNAILLLNKKGFGLGAGMLARSIFELAITARYIDNEKIARRFFKYDWIMRKGMYEQQYDNPLFRETIEEKIKKRDPKRKALEEVLMKAAKVKEEYPDIENYFHWSGVDSLKKMAKKVGLLDAYKSTYYLLCNLVHPNPRDTNEYLVESKGKNRADIGPNDKWIESSLGVIFDACLLIIYTWDEEYGSELKSKLDNLKKRFEKTGEAYKTSSKR
jgi:hypothetical protein